MFLGLKCIRIQYRNTNYKLTSRMRAETFHCYGTELLCFILLIIVIIVYTVCCVILQDNNGFCFIAKL